MCSELVYIDFVHILYCANIIIIIIYAHYMYYVCIILIHEIKGWSLILLKTFGISWPPRPGLKLSETLINSNSPTISVIPFKR